MAIVGLFDPINDAEPPKAQGESVYSFGEEWDCIEYGFFQGLRLTPSDTLFCTSATPTAVAGDATWVIAGASQFIDTILITQDDDALLTEDDDDLIAQDDTAVPATPVAQYDRDDNQGVYGGDGTNPPVPTSPGVPIDVYLRGMYWTASGSGTLNQQPFYPGAKIIARGAEQMTIDEVVFVVINTLPAPLYAPISSKVVNFATEVPDADLVDEYYESAVTLARRVDIFESDGVTPYIEDVAFTGGSISVDMARAERRNISLVLDDDRLSFGPGAFWYDKIIQPYRGIRRQSGDTWLYPLGTFMIDKIDRPRFPSTFSVSGRDRSKKLALDHFTQTTTFEAETPVSDIIRAIALNAGITSLNIPNSDVALTVDTTFEVNDSRLTAIGELALAVNSEVYFDAFGELLMRPFVDPLTAATTFTFLTGVEGNLSDYGRSTSDSLIFNDVVVYGSAQENALVYGRAQNTNNASPTSIDKLGHRTKTIPSQFVSDDTAAELIAQSFLSVSGLEQYDLSMSSIVTPWLEAGDAIFAYLPDAAPSEPYRFLLSSFSIPLELTSMSAAAKRVVNVG